MKIIRYFSVLLAVYSFFLLPMSVQAAPTRVIVSPWRAYVTQNGIQDWIYPDYVVEFDIPANAYDIVAYSTNPSAIEGRVFSYGRTFIEAPMSNGRRRVKVIAGYRARHCSHSLFQQYWNCNYTGSIVHFANSVRLRYYR